MACSLCVFWPKMVDAQSVAVRDPILALGSELSPNQISDLRRELNRHFESLKGALNVSAKKSFMGALSAELKFVEASEPFIAQIYAKKIPKVQQESREQIVISTGFIKSVLQKSTDHREASNTLVAALAQSLVKMQDVRPVGILPSVLGDDKVYFRGSADIRGAKLLEDIRIDGAAMLRFAEKFQDLAQPVMIFDKSDATKMGSHEQWLQAFERDRLEARVSVSRPSLLRTWLATRNMAERKTSVESFIPSETVKQLDGQQNGPKSDRFSHERYLESGLQPERKKSKFVRETKVHELAEHVGSISEQIENLEKKLDEISKQANPGPALDAFMKEAFGPFGSSDESLNSYRQYRELYGDNSRMLRLRSKTVQVLERLESRFDASARLKYFRQLTALGGQAETDRYFIKSVLPNVSRPADVARDMLEEPGILKTEGPRALALEKAFLHYYDGSLPVSWGQKFDKTVKPQTSRTWDEVRERLLNQHQINGSSLEYITPPSDGFEVSKLVTRETVEIENLMKTALEKMSNQDRYDFIAFVRDRSDRVPASLTQALKESVRTLRDPRAVYSALQSGKLTTFGVGHVANVENEIVALMESKLPSFVSELREGEQIGLIDHTLNSGQNPIAKQPDYPKSVLREILNYEADSRGEKTVLAWLSPRVTPADEIGPNLSFLLAQPKGQSSMKAIFESQGTVGKKIGQGLGHLGFFDPEDTKQLLELEDKAKGMSRVRSAEQLGMAIRYQNRDSRAEIKLKEELSSASVKSVYKVEVKPARKGAAPIEAVVAISDPNAPRDTKGKVTKLHLFIDELGRSEVVEASDVSQLHHFLNDVDLQLKEEFSFVNEAKKLRAAKAYYEGLNSDPKFKSSGWTFKVPQPIDEFSVTSNVMVLEFAKGVRFDTLSKADQMTAGPPLFRSTVRGLAGQGVDSLYESDRHKANQFFDAEKRVANILDVAQAENFLLDPNRVVWDERTQLADLIKAVGERDVSNVMKSIRGFAIEGWPSGDKLKRLEQKISEILKGVAKPDAVASDLVKAIRKEGVTLDHRLSLKVVKGLSTLSRQNYVSENEAKRIIAEEIRDTVLAKGPARFKAGTAKLSEVVFSCAVNFKNIAARPFGTKPATPRVLEADYY